LVGLSNPVAPPIRLWTEGSEIRGEMVFGTAYQAYMKHTKMFVPFLF